MCKSAVPPESDRSSLVFACFEIEAERDEYKRTTAVSFGLQLQLLQQNCRMFVASPSHYSFQKGNLFADDLAGVYVSVLYRFVVCPGSTRSRLCSRWKSTWKRLLNSGRPSRFSVLAVHGFFARYMSDERTSPRSCVR